MKRGHAVDPWHPGTVTFDPGRGGGSHAPVLRSDLREPLRAQRDPLASSGGRPRVNREDRGQFKKQGWLGRFVSTYGWRAYALPVLVVVTVIVLYQTVTAEPVQAPVVDDANIRVSQDIGDIRALVNVVVADGQGRRVRLASPRGGPSSSVQTQPDTTRGSPTTRRPARRTPHR